jgi:hypothetical protein
MTPVTRILVLLAVAVGCSRAEPEAVPHRTDSPSPDASPAVVKTGAVHPAGLATAVETEMHNVDFHIDSGIVLHITSLRGQLLPSRSTTPPALDDKQSFTLSLASAQIGIDTASLSTLLTRHVFAYSGSPLKDLRISTDGDQLIQRGVMTPGIAFTMRATVAVTPDGQIRLHPMSVKMAGLKVDGLMKFFGVNLEHTMKLKPGYGARIEGNDLILDPTGILPAPVIRGRLTGIRVENGQIAQTFGPPDSAAKPLRRLDPSVPNYMYFQHGTLRFGRLTMLDADLEIDDSDPGTPFDFSLDRYNDQLVAGYSKSTMDHGLIVHMPDLGTLTRESRK